MQSRQHEAYDAATPQGLLEQKASANIDKQPSTRTSVKIS